MSSLVNTMEINNLEQQLEKAKTNLKGLNNEIRRIVGRPMEDDRTDRKRPFAAFNSDAATRRSNNSDFSIDRRFTDGAPPNKKRITDGKSVFSRLSGPPGRFDDESKPKLSSRVIKEQPTREDIVAAQGSDEQSKARNRRIFGSLLGTLQKFCQEESRLKSKEEKKAQIEKKLEEQQKKEREILRKEKQNLFSDRRKQQLEIRAMEIKMLKMKDLAAWIATKKPLAGFIRTKARPHLYYLPKVLNQKSQDRLKRSREDVERMIEKKRQQVNEEIATIEARLASDIRSIEKNGDAQGIEEKDRDNEDEYDEYETEVSFVDNNNSNVPFEVDYDGVDEQHESDEHSRQTLVKQEKDLEKAEPSNSGSSIVMIKKERQDEEDDSHLPNAKTV